MAVNMKERKKLIEERWKLLREEEFAKGDKKVELRSEIDRLSVIIQESMATYRIGMPGGGN